MDKTLQDFISVDVSLVNHLLMDSCVVYNFLLLQKWYDE